jgi:hypothetical protein
MSAGQAPAPVIAVTPSGSFLPHHCLGRNITKLTTQELTIMTLLSPASQPIEIGTEYSATGRVFAACDTVWRVEHLFTAPDGISHVRLVNARSRKEIKTLSAAALLDTRTYRPAAQPR